MEETESVPIINIENNEQVRKLIGDEGISIVIKCVNETVIGYGYQNSSSVSYREMSVSDDSIQLEFVININEGENKYIEVTYDLETSEATARVW